jgi:uncharacterized protein YcfL
MKFKLLYLIFGLFFLGGCSSEDDNGNEDITGFDYFIRFRANGQLVEYKFIINNSNIPESRVTGVINADETAWSGYPLDEDIYVSLINASVGLTEEDAEFFQIGVFTEEPIGTNVEYTKENSFGISAFYNNGTNVYFHDSVEEVNVNITWTSITETEARGRFSGTLYDENDTPLEITDGEFYVLSSMQ